MKYLLGFVMAALISSTATAQSIDLPQPKKRRELAVDLFSQLPRGRGAELSPDGDYFAYKYPQDGRDGLVIEGLGANRGEGVFVPPQEDGELGWFRWVTNERLLISFAFFQEIRGQEMTFTQMVGIDRDGGNIINFFNPNDRQERGGRLGNIRDRVIDFLPDDPDHVLVAIDKDWNGKTEVRRLNINTGKFKRIQAERAGIQHWYTDPSGRVRYGHGYFNDEKRAVIYDGKKLRNAKKMDWFDTYTLQDFVNTGTLAYATSSQSGQTGFYTIDIDTGELVDTIWTHPDLDLSTIARDLITGQIIGIGFDDHYHETRYFDAEWQKLQRSIDRVFKNTANAIVGQSKDKKLMLVKTSSDMNPGVLYIWDRSTKNIAPILPVRPGINPAEMAHHLPVSYEARDGLMIPGYITFPVDYREGEKRPTVLLPHGGPHARDTRYFDYKAQFLANRGYIVLQPNFRGSEGYGLGFELMGRKQWGGIMQDDLTDAAHWLVKEGYSDPDKICIVGGSYGGYAALMGAIKTPDLFACAASLNGVMDMERLVREDKNTIGGKAWVKSFGLTGASLEDVSPYHRASEIKIPVLIAQAVDDSRVPDEHGRKMAGRLKSRKKDVTYLKIKSGGHSLVNEASRKAWLLELEAFLDKHIGG